MANKILLWTETAFLFFMHLCNGATIGMDEMSIDELSRRTNSNYAQISAAFSGDGYGFIVGLFACGSLMQRSPKKLEYINFAAALLLGLSTFAVPWISNRALLGIAFGVRGVGRGAIKVVAVKMCAQSWGGNMVRPLMFISASLGLGVPTSRIMGALLKVPNSNNSTYIKGIKNFIDKPTTPSISVSPNRSSWSNSIESQLSNVRLPMEEGYMIIASVCVSVALAFLLFVCLVRKCNWNDLERLPLKTSNEVELLSDPDLSSKKNSLVSKLERIKQVRSFCMRDKHLLHISLLMVIYLAYGAFGQGFFYKFAYDYVTESAGFSVEEGTNLHTALYIALMVARMSSAKLLKWVPCRHMFLVCNLLTVLCSIAISFLHKDVPHYAFWIGFIAISFFSSTISSLIMGMANELVEIPGLVIAIIHFGDPIGSMSMVVVAGVLFDGFGLQVFPFIELFICVILTFLSCFLLFISKKRN